MRPGKVFWKIIKRTNADKIVYGFLGYFCLCAFLIWMVEPGIPRLGDSVWYSFSVITSIGFGDYTAVTMIGRTISIVLGIYGAVVLAMIPGILVSYYMEIMQIRKNENVNSFMYQLEHLDELSKEELKEVSEKVKNWKMKSNL